jgi:hypothetical protein
MNELFTEERLAMEDGVEQGFKYGKMGQFILVIGLAIK